MTPCMMGRDESRARLKPALLVVAVRLRCRDVAGIGVLVVVLVPRIGTSRLFRVVRRPRVGGLAGSAHRIAVLDCRACMVPPAARDGRRSLHHPARKRRCRRDAAEASRHPAAAAAVLSFRRRLLYKTIIRNARMSAAACRGAIRCVPLIATIDGAPWSGPTCHARDTRHWRCVGMESR